MTVQIGRERGKVAAGLLGAYVTNCLEDEQVLVCRLERGMFNFSSDQLNMQVV